MAKKHTRGPWEIHLVDDTCVIDQNGTQIATTAPEGAGQDADVDFETNWETCEANARLIAAAPELLAALSLALEYWRCRQQRYRNRSPVWVENARSAIRKATENIPDGA